MDENDQPTSNSTSRLLVQDSKEYGADWRAHILEQYKICHASAEAHTVRRQNNNKLFLTLHLALVASMLLVREKATLPPEYETLLAVGGLLFCLAWMLSIVSSNKLLDARLSILNEMEEWLPLRPFAYEWQEKLGRYRRVYRIGSVYLVIPAVFAIAYIAMCIFRSKVGAG